MSRELAMMGYVMRMLAGVAVVAMAGLLMGQGRGAAAGGVGGGDVDANGVVAPYVDGQTILVGHVDVGQLDTGAVEAFIGRMLEARPAPANDWARREMAAARLAVDGFLARFKQLGGRHVFVVMAHQDIYPGVSGPAFLFRIEAGGDANGMVEFFKALRGEKRSPESIERLGEMVVVAQGAATVERLKQVKPVARPELRLSGGRGAEGPPVELIGALSADQKRVIRELMPSLPSEMGGGNSEALVESLVQVRLRGYLPPEPRVELVLSHGNASGSGWRRVIAGAREKVLSSRELASELESGGLRARSGEIRKLISDVLTPAEGRGEMGETTTFTLSAEQIRGAAGMLMAEGLSNARTAANRTASMTVIRRLLIGCLTYAAEHGNQLPAKLEDAARYFDKPVGEMVKIPGDAAGRAYVYRPVAGELSKVKNPSGVPIVWEPLGGSEGVNVGFMDGHVEYMPQAAAEAAIRGGAGTQPGLP
jgi:prepilin-type processing-associated H-X9-DG protein